MSKRNLSDAGLQDLMHFAFHRAFWEGAWLLRGQALRTRLLEIAYESAGVERIGRRQRRKLSVLAEAYAVKLELRKPI